MPNKSYYNSILSQTFSPCGNFLIVGDIYGEINVFHITKIVNLESGIKKEDRKPKNTFTVQEDVQINSLLTTENLLLVGTAGEILGYTWNNIKTQKTTMKPSWKVEIPDAKKKFEKIDVNCMLYDEEEKLLYAGCGDNNVHIINLEEMRTVGVLEEHEDYIHCITRAEKQVISGGEDGTVNIWDTRVKYPVSSIVPHTNSKLQRTDLGKWIGAMDFNDDWLICGGGPRLSIWHFKMLNLSTVFPIDDKGIHVAKIHEDRVLAGGRTKYFYQMNLNGEIVSEIKHSSVSIYSAVYHKEPNVLCLSGSSPNIDICSTFNYCDQVLSLYDKSKKY